ncbi:17157_t:CDS:1, partial [Entrophospora sp. SA101]
ISRWNDLCIGYRNTSNKISGGLPYAYHWSSNSKFNPKRLMLASGWL